MTIQFIQNNKSAINLDKKIVHLMCFFCYDFVQRLNLNNFQIFYIKYVHPANCKNTKTFCPFHVCFLSKTEPNVTYSTSVFIKLCIHSKMDCYESRRFPGCLPSRPTMKMNYLRHKRCSHWRVVRCACWPVIVVQNQLCLFF